MPAKFIRSLASPTLLRTPSGTPKSILKRPAALPLSPGPFPFSASFSILVSQSPTSPHVHFPNSAAMTSTFSAHSPNTYDRASIVVSPNPLALPAYGDRIFSPTSGVFKSASERSLDEMIASSVKSPSVTITDFDKDAIAKPVKAKPQSRASIRFQQNVRKAAPLPRNELGDALLRFPRSPYPSAPMSPMMEKENVVVENKPAMRKRVQSMYGVSPSLISRVRDAAAVKADQSTDAAALARKVLSPVEESPETRLSHDFWQSVTLEQPSMETPTSAVPQFVFGTKDGALWSPGLPRSNTLGVNSMLSPLSRTSFSKMPNASALMSPTPNDAFSGFPSFSAVLSMGGDMVTYPPAAVVERGAEVVA